MAMYSLQALAVLPDWPTWRLFGNQPASAIGREQPRVAPSSSARSRNCCTLASSPMPRPIARMNSAAVMSTSSLAGGSTNSTLRTREATAGAGRLDTAGSPEPSGGL